MEAVNIKKELIEDTAYETNAIEVVDVKKEVIEQDSDNQIKTMEFVNIKNEVNEDIFQEETLPETSGDLPSVDNMLYTVVDPSYVTRNKRGQPIEASQKQTVFNVFQRYIEMGSNKSNSVRLAAASTGLSERSIWKIIDEKKRTDEFNPPNRKKTRKKMYDKLDETQLNTVRKHVHNIFLKNQSPSLSKVLVQINNDESLPNMGKETLRQLMTKLDFKFGKKGT